MPPRPRDDVLVVPPAHDLAAVFVRGTRHPASSFGAPGEVGPSSPVRTLTLCLLSIARAPTRARPHWAMVEVRGSEGRLAVPTKLNVILLCTLLAPDLDHGPVLGRVPRDALGVPVAAVLEVLLQEGALY